MDSYFNSTEVRLRDWKPCKSRQPKPHFNSTEVRLRVLLQIGIWWYINLFQFHWGTIKGQGASPAKLHRDQFQFHWGTIKGFRCFRGLFRRTYFNSTEVRLRAAGYSYPAGCRFHFNSTEVRLRDRKDPNAIEVFFAFQFHWGTIKGILVLAPVVLKPNFNSTEVRLRVQMGVLFFRNTTHFNSTEVRLRDAGLRKHRHRWAISIPLRYD